MILATFLTLCSAGDRLVLAEMWGRECRVYNNVQDILSGSRNGQAEATHEAVLLSISDNG